jgi:hypothetical protein
VYTEVTSLITTYCSEATTLTYSSQTYPVTAPGTVTIPVVISTPVSAPAASSPAASAPSASTWYQPTTIYYTTYCPPESSVVVISSQTYPVSTPGYVTIPIVTSTPIVVSSPGGVESTSAGIKSTPAVGVSTAIGTTYVPSQATASTSAPIQANGAMKNGASIGAFVAAIAAAFL